MYSIFLDESSTPYYVTRGFLSTPILFGNSTNTLSLTVPTSTLPVDNTNLNTGESTHYIEVFSESGPNSSYTLSINANAPKDHFDSVASNETQATASQLTARDPSQIIFREDAVTFHSINDVDWYRFTAKISGNYHARIGQALVWGPNTPFGLEVRNSLGQLLSSPLPSTSPTFTFSVFTASAGETYFIKALPESPGASYYDVNVSLITSEEPVPPQTHRGNPPYTPLDISSIASGPISFGPYSLDSPLTDLSSIYEFDLIDFVEIPEGRYLITVESENLTPPTVLDAFDLTTYGNRSLFFLNWDEPSFFEIFATNDDQLGFYSVTVRPTNDFDNWWGGRPIESDIEINGLPAGVIYALDLDRSADHGDLFQIASNASVVSLVLPLSPGGTNAPVVLQESTDLVTWSNISSENLNQPSATIPAGTFGNVSISYPIDEPRRFVRVAVPE